MKKIFSSLKFSIAIVFAFIVFASFSPSLDGRALVADEGVFPKGYFAKTVGYLPGDSIKVTNPVNGERVDILVIGSLDASEGVAILLSPEAAEALGIKKNSNNIVKLTKRNGTADEVVSGSAVITKGAAPDFENENPVAAKKDDVVSDASDKIPDESGNSNETALNDSIESEKLDLSDLQNLDDFYGNALAQKDKIGEEEILSDTSIWEDGSKTANGDFFVAQSIPEDDSGLLDDGLITEVLIPDENDDEGKEVAKREDFVEDDMRPGDEDSSKEQPDEKEYVNADEFLDGKKPLDSDVSGEKVIADEIPDGTSNKNDDDYEYVAADKISDDVPDYKKIAEDENQGEFVKADDIKEDDKTPPDTTEVAKLPETDDKNRPIILPTDANPPKQSDNVAKVQEKKPDVTVVPKVDNYSTEFLPSSKKEPPVEYPRENISLRGNYTYLKDERELASQKYYVQIAVYRFMENVEEVGELYGSRYPIVVVDKGNDKKAVLVGPFGVDEYGTVLERFRAYGYKDAFAKKVR